MKTEGLKAKQIELIKKNAEAFEYWFPELTIVASLQDKGFYVYLAGREEYVQYCYNIDYLNGWLYGAVQRECGQVNVTPERRLELDSRKKMTHNEYWNYCRDEVAKGNYDALKEDIVILPFDLSEYPQITERTAKWIQALFSYDDVDRNGYRMLTGDCRHASGPYGECQKLNCECHMVDGYRTYGFNDEEMMVYTYCEHDTTLKMFNDKAAYEKEKADTIKFYKEAY